MKKNSPEQYTPKKKGGLLGRIIRRFFLLLFTTIVLILAALILAANLIFNGPSPAARSILTMTLLEPSATKWIPALFIGEDGVAEVRAQVSAGPEEELTNTSQVVIQKNAAIDPNAVDEWADYPDGIRIDTVEGDTFTAYIMIIKDPSRVYMGLSTYNGFSTAIPGKRLNVAMEDEGAAAGVNAGAFNDNGTVSKTVGSAPLGLVMSKGSCAWSTGKQPDLEGFAGFNTDDILVVSQKNLTKEQAAELNIRDGCCFGPALIINGETNMSAYNSASGWNPRTAVGQRSDGAVLFVCADGRQVGSMGATYADIIDIMVEYGAVNACNMDGGSSTIMMYRDTNGRYGEAGQVVTVNNYSLLQSEPRRMPNFWMVRPQE